MSDNEQPTPDLAALLSQAQALQEQLLQAQQEATSRIIEGKAAGGKVTVGVTGGFEFQAVHIAPELTDDVEMLEDLVLAALRDAASQIGDLNQAAVGGLFDDA